MKYFLLPLFLLLVFTTSAQTTHQVLVANMSYTPSELTIEVGDQVTFILEGGMHDVNFNISVLTGEPFDNPVEITSLPMQSEPGEMGTITFDVPGTYNYDCSMYGHASMGMVGSIIVEETAAQSLSVDVDSYYHSLPSETCTAHFDVTNLTAQDLSVIVTRTSDADIPSYFCWGVTCYPPATNVSTNAIVIPAGESSDQFSGYINNMPEESSYVINYCFSVENNPADQVCTDVTFTSLSEYLSIEEVPALHNVYPNPVKDILFIDCNTLTEFVLFDMLGSQVHKEVFSSSSNINVSSFEAGIYFYKLKVKGKETEVQKLIITH